VRKGCAQAFSPSNIRRRVAPPPACSDCWRARALPPLLRTRALSAAFLSSLQRALSPSSLQTPQTRILNPKQSSSYYTAVFVHANRLAERIGSEARRGAARRSTAAPPFAALPVCAHAGPTHVVFHSHKHS